MIKYFYKLIYKKEGDLGDMFNLGVFSTKFNAKLKIEKALMTKGFNNEKCFEIIKFGVKFQNDIQKSGIKLYSVEHEYSVEENGEIIDIINIFDIVSSNYEAENKVEYLKNHSQLGRKYPQNFEINEIVVDEFSSWSEGFSEY